MKKVLRSLFLLLVGLIAMGSGRAIKPAPSATEAPPVVEPAAAAPSADWVGTWRLESMEEGGASLALPPGAVATLKLDNDGGMGGTAFINRYFGHAVFDEEGGVSWPPAFGSTKMAGPEKLMALETAYFRLLPSTSRFHLVEGRLVLESPDSAVRLVFAARDE